MGSEMCIRDRATIDWVAAHPDLKDRIDWDRVYVAGFSYGGWTALSLSGLQSNLQGFVDACEEHGDTLTLCDDLLKPAVNIQGFNRDLWQASYRDDRIAGAVVIDPGLVWGVDMASAASINPNIHIIGLGAGEDRMLATNFDARGLAAMLRQVKVDRITPATHFSAMPICKPRGAAILAAEGDDPICDDPVGADRSAIHQRLIEITKDMTKLAG